MSRKRRRRRKGEWQKTPFTTLEQAHKVAERMALNPSCIADASDHTIRSFTICEGRAITLVAQRADGEGPVLERELKKALPLDPSVPRFREADRLQAGPWTQSQHDSLEAVEAYWRGQYVNFDNVEVLKLVLYRIDSYEYEYGVDEEGAIWSRVLHKRK